MTSLSAWMAQHGFDLLQSLGIVGGLLLTTLTVRLDLKSRWVENHLKITQHHRDLWRQLSQNPELKRILQADIDLEKTPVTTEEERFVTMVILHLNTHYYATTQRMLRKPEGLAKDVSTFFALPIPKAIWSQSRHLRDRRFGAFVDGALSGSEESSDG